MSDALTIRPGTTPVPPWGMSRFAESVYRSLGGLTAPDPENRYALAALVEALCWLPSLIHDAARPEPGTGETAWAAVVDPWRCPWWALRWCGQIYGLRLTPDLGAFVRPPADLEQAWRQAIHDRAGWRRGHPDTIRAVARQFQRPDSPQRVKIRERYDGTSTDAPYHHQIRIRRSDLKPGVDDETVLRAVRAAIPIGRISDIQITDDATYDDRRDEHATYDAMRAAYATYHYLRDAD